MTFSAPSTSATPSPALAACTAFRATLKPSQLALGVMAAQYHDGDSRLTRKAQGHEVPGGSMTGPTYARVPGGPHRLGIHIEGLGLYDEQSAERLVSYIASALRKYRRREVTGAVAVTPDPAGVRLAGLGVLSTDQAIALADALVDACEEGAGDV